MRDFSHNRRFSARKVRHESSLFTLTKNVHTRLPREVRDMICAYLLTPHELFTISRHNPVRMDKVSSLYGVAPENSKTREARRASLPAYIDADKAYAPFAAEVVEMVFGLDHYLCIDKPSAIPTFLDVDFFGLGVTLRRHARLSKLRISGTLDAHQPNSINLATLASDFQTLLTEYPWTPTFVLDIGFHTHLGVADSDYSAIAATAHTMHTVWQTLKPWLEEAEKRGACIYFGMLTRGAVHKYTCGEHDMLETEKEWEQTLRDTWGWLGRRPRRTWRGVWVARWGCLRGFLGRCLYE